MTYLERWTAARDWDEQTWRRRREMLADVWYSHEEERRKKILAMLVAHAPEVVSE